MPERKVMLQDEIDAAYDGLALHRLQGLLYGVQIAMGNQCNDCYKQQEMMYWAKMKFILFYQILTEGFHEQLAIPEKFTRNLRDKLPEKVILRDPSYNIWDVKIAKIGDGLFFKDGWGEFAKDLCLQENDMCIFKYDGQSQFDVSIFDGSTFCERESSHFYFNHQCGCKKQTQREAEAMQVPASKSLKRRENENNDEADVESRRQEDDGTTVAHQPKQCSKQVVSNPGTPTYSGVPTRKRSNSGANQSDTTKRAGQQKAKSYARKRTSTNSYPEEYISQRRVVSQEEINAAYNRAKAAATPRSFWVVMKPTHVYRGFFMAIPAGWARNNLPEENVAITLRVKEGSVTKDKTWAVTISCENGECGLFEGWKIFSVANNLEEDDVCVFELDSRTDDFIVMNVTIFRVLQEMTPLQRNSASIARSAKYPQRK